MRNRSIAVVFVLLWGGSAAAMPGAHRDGAMPPMPAGSAPNAWAMVNSPSGPVKASLFSGEHADLPIARVDSQVVTLADLTEALTALHEGMDEVEKGGKRDFKPLVERLVSVRLLVLEALEMGLHELPDVKKRLDSAAAGAARDFVKQRALVGLEPDKAEVEQRYREATRQFKVRSALFNKEEDAKALVAAVRAGGDYLTLAKKAVQEKKASGELNSEYLPRAQALTVVVEALRPLKVGEITGALSLPAGYTVLRLEDVRYEEDPAALERANEAALARARQVALKKQGIELLNKWAKVDEKLLSKLDFEAKKPGFAALRKDKRVVVRLGKTRTITVADLARELEAEFFHGIETPIREKRVNARLGAALQNLAQKAAYDLEAEALRVTRDPDYKRVVEGNRVATLFGIFIQRAILPGVKLSDSEVKQHYAAHTAEYSYPGFYKLYSLGFSQTKAAQKAADKLRAGTDFKWLRAHADHQLKEEARAFDLNGSLITETGLTRSVARTLAGAKTGDVRLHREGDQHYVIWVQQLLPPAPRPFEEVREEIAKKLHDEKVTAAIAEWTSKLRKHRKVEIYITQLSS